MINFIDDYISSYKLQKVVHSPYMIHKLMEKYDVSEIMKL